MVLLTVERGQRSALTEDVTAYNANGSWTKHRVE
jgi:hypothetical protein